MGRVWESFAPPRFRSLTGITIFCLLTMPPLPVTQEPGTNLADELVGKLQVMRERYENDVHEPEDFEVSEAEANAFIKYRLSGQLPEGVVDPWVRFSNGPVEAGAMLDLAVLRDRVPESSIAQLISGLVPVELAATLHAEDGVGKLTLESVTLAGFPVPASFLQQVVSSYTKSPSRPEGVRLDEPFPLPFGIKRAQIEPGRLLIHQNVSREVPSGDSIDR